MVFVSLRCHYLREELKVLLHEGEVALVHQPGVEELVTGLPGVVWPVPREQEGQRDAAWAIACKYQSLRIIQPEFTQASRTVSSSQIMVKLVVSSSAIFMDKRKKKKNI